MQMKNKGFFKRFLSIVLVCAILWNTESLTAFRVTASEVRKDGDSPIEDILVQDEHRNDENPNDELYRKSADVEGEKIFANEVLETAEAEASQHADSESTDDKKTDVSAAPEDDVHGISVPVEAGENNEVYQEEHLEDAEDTTNPLNNGLSSKALPVEGTCGENIKWSFYEAEGKVVISGAGVMEDYKDASSVPWKNYLQNIVEVCIEDGVTNIGMYAFANCKSLKKVKLSNGITSIGYRAFYNCTSLEDVNMPVNWADCPTSKAGTVNSDYCGHIFEGCQSLKKITIQEGMKAIPSYGLCYSDYLEEIELPGSLTEIKNHTFYKCTKLLSVTIPEGVASIGKSAFCYCSALQSVSMSEGVTELALFAFYNCVSLEKVTLPDSIVKIGFQAFADCAKLSKINIPLNWKECPTANNDGTMNTDGCGHIFEGCKLLKKIEIPEGKKTLPGFAFNMCNYLEDVKLPSTLTSISNHCFFDCSKLQGVTIPEGVTSINKSAFNACRSIVSIEMPETVTSVGSFAFESCPLLETVHMADAIEKIGYRAFANCPKLESINIPLNWKECLSSNSSETINSGNSGHIFEDCESLTMIELPLGMTNIPRYGFCYSNYITEVKLPESITTMERCAFYDCTSLVNINIPKSVSCMEEYSFGNCRSLRAVKLNEGLKEIKDYTFSECSALAVVSIPKSVAEIGSDAFEYCDILSNIYYGGTEEQWNNAIGKKRAEISQAKITFGVLCECEEPAKILDSHYTKPQGVSIEDFYGGILRDGGHSIVDVNAAFFGKNRKNMFVSIPKDSYITFGFEKAMKCPDNSVILMTTTGNVNERADIYLETASGQLQFVGTTYEKSEYHTVPLENVTDYVTGIKVVGRDLDGDSPGFDLVDIMLVAQESDIFSSENSNTRVSITRGEKTSDLLKEEQVFFENSEEEATILVSGDWGGKNPGTIALVQDNNVILDNKGGAFVDIKPATLFKSSKSVYVVLLDIENNIIEKRKTKLRIEVRTQSRTSQSTKNISLTIQQNKYKSNVEKDEYKTCKGATITSGGREYKSDKKGKATIPTPTSGSILVEKGGYVSRSLTAEQLKESKVICLQKENREFPVISAVWVNDTADVLNNGYDLNMLSKDKITMKAEVEWGNSAYESIQLVQDEKSAEFSGDVLTTVMSNKFDTSQTIFIVAENQNGRVSKKALKFENGTTSKALKSLKEAKFEMGGSISVSLPETVPEFFKKTKIRAGVSSIVPITISAEDSKVYVAIGVDLVNYEYSDNFASGKHKSEVKTFIDKFKDTGILNGESASNSLKKFKNLKQTYNRAIKCPKGSFGVDADFTFLGFIEGCYDDNGKFTWLDSGIIANPSVSAHYDQPFSLPIGPIVIPMYFETAFNADVKAQGNLRFNETVKTFVPNIEIKGEISLSGGVGVGIKKVLYAGGGVEGKLEPDWKIYWDIKNGFKLNNYFKLTASINAYVKAGIACFEASKKFDPVYEKVWIEIPKPTKSKAKQSQIDALSDKEFDIYSTSKYKLKDLSYLDKKSEFVANSQSVDKKSAYVANSQRIEDGINLLGEDMGGQAANVVSSELKTNIYKESTPKLVSWKDGRQLAVWIDGTSDDANGLVLYYSYFDGITWTQPKAVSNDGTMDYAPMLAIIGDTAYVTWQNATKPFSLTDSSTLEDMAGDFDISVARFEAGKGFVTTTIPNENLDMAPYLCGNEDNVYVVWCNNAKNDWLGNNAENSICSCKISGNSYENVVIEEKGLKSIDSLCADYDIGLRIAYSMDTDGDIASADDLRVFENGSRVSNTDGAESSPVFMDHQLYWYSNNNVLNQKGSITGGMIPTDRYELIEIAGKKAAVYTVSDGLNSTLKMSYLNEETNTWGDPMSLSDGTDYIASYSVAAGTDHQLKILANSMEVTGDFEEENPYGPATLKLLSTNPRCDIALSDVAYDESTFCAGNPMEFYFTITNKGTLPVEAVVAEIYDSKNNLLSSLDLVSLILPGETMEASTYFTVPEDMVKDDIRLTIRPKDMTDSVDVDNAEKIHLEYEDLAIEDITCGQMDDGKYAISAEVVNRGYEERDNITLTLRKDSVTGERIDSKAIDSIAAMDICVESFEVDAKHGDIYYVVLEQEEDPIVSNNSDFVQVSIPDSPEYVSEMISNLPELDELTINDKDTIQEIRSNYDSLSEADKKKVPQELVDILIAAEERIAILEKDGEHKWDNGVITKKPTCSTKGVKTYTCSECGETKTESVPIDSTRHSWGSYVTTKKATVFATGTKIRTCSVCGKKKAVSIKKLPATMKLNAKSITLKVKQSTSKVKVSGLAAGDKVKSWKSSNTKVVKVTKTGKITAQKKTGKATLIIILKSGKKATVKVKVQKGAVKTAKISGLPKRVKLKVKQKRTLKPVISPITSVQKVTYSSANKKIATVNSKGKITAKKAGKTTITVKSGSKKYVISVSVSR